MDALCVSVGWLLWYKHRAWVCWDGGLELVVGLRVVCSSVRVTGFRMRLV